MSTPSDTMRTDTIHGRSFLENSSMVLEAPGSSLTTTSAGTPNRSRNRRAIPWACSWSIAITSPPASGWPPSCTGVERIVRSWSTALASTDGIHSPSRLSAVRSRIDAWSRVSSSWNEADSTSPDGGGPLHLAVDAWEVHRPHDASVAQGVGVPVRVVGVREVAFARRVVADEGDLHGIAAERGARQREAPMSVREGRADPVPHAFSWPAWCTSSRITNPSADRPASLDAAGPVATCW